MPPQAPAVSSAPELFPLDEARRIGDACVATLAYVTHCDGWKQDPRAYALKHACVEGLRYAAAALACAPEESDLPRFVAWLEALQSVDSWELPDMHLHARALAPALRLADEPDAKVAALVEDGPPPVRFVIAENLRLDHPAHLELLRALAADGDTEVREEARKRLASVEEVPWWRGKFSRDPLARLGPAEASSVGPVLNELHALLDDPEESDATWPALRALLDRLPLALLLDLAEVLLERPEQHERATVLVRALLARPGSDEALWALCERWEGDSDVHRVLGRIYSKERFAEGDPAHRAAQCVALARRVCALPQRARRAGGMTSAAANALKILEHQWPRAADPTPLVELLLAAQGEGEGEGEGWDTPLRDLAARIGKTPFEALPAALLERVERAHTEGYAGAWGLLASAGRRWMNALPMERRRALAARLLHERGDDRKTLVWCLTLLAGEGYDPALDPPHAQLGRAWLATPPLRAAVLADHALRRRLLSLLRDELRDGTLTGTAALSVAHDVAGLFDADVPARSYRPDGTADPSEAPAPAWWRGEERAQEAQRAKERAELGGWLTAGARVGPLDEDEWARVRAERDGPEGLGEEPRKPMRRSNYAGQYVMACPPRTSAWRPEERARVAGWFALAQRDWRFAEVAWFSMRAALVAADQPEDAAWFAAQFAFTREDRVGRPDKEWAAFCARTGADPRSIPEAAPAPSDDDDGEDEEEEEEEEEDDDV